MAVEVDLPWVAAYRALAPAIERAKLDTDGKRFGLHSFRHAYATRLILSRRDPQVVARLLGHSSTALLFARYSHAFDALRGTTELHAAVEGALTGAQSA